MEEVYLCPHRLPVADRHHRQRTPYPLKDNDHHVQHLEEIRSKIKILSWHMNKEKMLQLFAMYKEEYVTTEHSKGPIPRIHAKNLSPMNIQELK